MSAKVEESLNLKNEWGGSRLSGLREQPKPGQQARRKAGRDSEIRITEAMGENTRRQNILSQERSQRKVLRFLPTKGRGQNQNLRRGMKRRFQSLQRTSQRRSWPLVERREGRQTGQNS